MERKRSEPPPATGPALAWEFVPIGDEPKWLTPSPDRSDTGGGPNDVSVVDSRALAFAALGAALLLAALVLL